MLSVPSRRHDEALRVLAGLEVVRDLSQVIEPVVGRRPAHADRDRARATPSRIARCRPRRCRSPRSGAPVVAAAELGERAARRLFAAFAEQHLALDGRRRHASGGNRREGTSGIGMIALVIGSMKPPPATPTGARPSLVKFSEVTLSAVMVLIGARRLRAARRATPAPNTAWFTFGSVGLTWNTNPLRFARRRTNCRSVSPAAESAAERSGSPRWA